MPEAALLAQSLGIPDLGLLLVKLLAVAGGAAVGGLAGGWLLQLTCRLAVHRSVPRPVLTLVRLLSGFLAGLLVWLWVFSPAGSGGLGGGGGWWPFGGKGGQPGASATMPAKETAPKEAARPPEPVPAATANTLRVTLLGGQRVRDQRFYVLEGDPMPRTLDEVKEAIRQRRERDPALKNITIVLFKDSVDKDNPAVTALRTWAEDKGYTVTLSFPAAEPLVDQG